MLLARSVAGSSFECEELSTEQEKLDFGNFRVRA